MAIKYILSFIVLQLFLFAMPNKPSEPKEQNLLPQSKALYADDIFDINSTTSRSNFQHFGQRHFLLYSPNKNLWLKLEIDASAYKEPVFYISSPLLTKVNIYDTKGRVLAALGYGKKKEMTLLPYYELKSKKVSLYLQMQSRYMPLVGEVTIAEKESFFYNDAKRKFYTTLLLGLLLMVMLLLLVQLYLNRKRETLLLLLLIALLSYYQFTYSGLAATVVSNSYALLDIAITTIKINFITIIVVLYTAALLKVSKRSLLYTIFKGLVLFAVLELFLAGFMNLPLLYALIPLIATLLLALAALYGAARKSDIEYIFPFIGYTFLLIFFVSQILISLGIDSLAILQERGEWVITIALLFIAGRNLYSYIRKEKSNCNSVLDGLDRKYLLESMLQTKRDELTALNEAKEILKHDIHTVIDNNFKQILLSLQSDSGSVDYSKLTKQLSNVEQRMQAISICYSHMLENKNLTTIDMKSVIDEIIEQIKSLYAYQNCTIEIETDIEATLAINDAVIAATAISEIVMDSYKNSCHKEEGFVLVISLKESKESYSLSVKDYPKGKRSKKEVKSTLQKLKEKLQQLRMGG